jgi:hypothetical protein
MIEDDDTRLIFVDPDDWAETAIVKPNGEDEFSIVGIFDARQVAERSLKGAQPFKHAAEVTGNEPQFRCRESDAARIKAGRAILSIRGRDYAVFSNKPDSTGFSILILKVA